MFKLFLILHVIISAALVLVILLQSSKGEGLAGAFGGGGITSAVFGGRGAATFLSRATTVLAIGFFVSCLTLTVLYPTGGGTGRSDAVQREAQKTLQRQQPASPDDEGQVQQQPSQSTDQTGTGSILPPAPETSKTGGN